MTRAFCAGCSKPVYSLYPGAQTCSQECSAKVSRAKRSAVNRVARELGILGRKKRLNEMDHTEARIAIVAEELAWREHYRNMLINRQKKGICIVCETALPAGGSRHVFCSAFCSGLHHTYRERSKDPEKLCQQCGLCLPARFRHARFCCEYCRQTWRNENHKQSAQHKLMVSAYQKLPSSRARERGRARKLTVVMQAFRQLGFFDNPNEVA